VSVALRIEDLTVRYANTVAVAGVSLQVNSGEILAVLGANGAGKTSLIEAAIGLRKATSGNVTALGGDPTSAYVRGRTGVMLQTGGLYPSVRPLAWLNYLSQLYPNPAPARPLLDSVGIPASNRTVNRRLSGGEQQRVKLAAALLPQPDLLYLDEPTAGVDALGRQSLVEIVRAQAAAGVAVVLTTHLLTDVEDLADRVIVLTRGRVQAEGTLEELTNATSAIRFFAPENLPIEDLERTLGPDYLVTRTPSGAYVVDGPVTPDALATITRWCADLGVFPQGLKAGSHSLIDLLADSARDDRSGESS